MFFLIIFLNMKNKRIKVAVLYNESNPDIYHPSTIDMSKLDFIPYFDIPEFNPVEEYRLMAEKLSAIGYDAYSFNVKDDLNSLLENLEKDKPDVVFNFIELFKDDPRFEMNMCGLLELLGIPYTGATPLGLANCQSKFLTKKILSSIGILIPKHFYVSEFPFNVPEDIRYPMIVKPAFEDGSAGIENDSIVFNEESLRKRIEYIYTSFNQPVLIDEYIDGRELNVSVVGDKEPFILPISEIDFSKMPDNFHRIVSYQAKWEASHETYHKTIPICPAILPDGIEEKIKEIAIKSFNALEVRDYARIDMRLTPDGRIYVLEVNPNPDITEGVGLMRSAVAMGYKYEEVLDMILKFALARKKGS